MIFTVSRNLKSPVMGETAADCGRPATNDGNRQADGVADAHLLLFDVEGLPEQ